MAFAVAYPVMALVALAVHRVIPGGWLLDLPLAVLSEIIIASVLISLAAYILLGLFLRPLVGVVLRGSRDSLLPPA